MPVSSWPFTGREVYQKRIQVPSRGTPYMNKAGCGTQLMSLHFLELGMIIKSRYGTYALSSRTSVNYRLLLWLNKGTVTGQLYSWCH